MPKKKINYKDLLDHLIQNTDELTKKQKIPLEEFPAVASHYLQSDGLHSIYGGEKAIKEYEYQINSFSGIEETIQDFVPLRQQLHFNFNEVPFPPPKNPKFTFVDMFAGIGGFRIAFQELGGKCLFSCEWDKFAKQTYLANFGETPFGDVRQFTDPEKVSDKELEKIFENTSFSSYSRPNKRHIKWQAVFSTLLNDSVTLINKNDSDSKKSQKENFKSSVKKLISKSLHKAEKNGLEQRDYHKQKPEENFEQIDDNIIKKTIPKKSRADEADAYYIENSGLVVLWPFLNNFFQNSGLVENNQFISFEAQERGALLLQYIADGSEKASEQLMPLNKILCGIDIEAPINLELEISEKEKTESENLIAVLIERWIALKNMSPESVKSIFIRRQGIIKRNPGNWFIQVEKKPPDILLNKLPWSISVIKLPWRNDLIYVQW